MHNDGRITYDRLLTSINDGGGKTALSIESYLHDIGGNTGRYTVYWPHDSIRVIKGSDYGVARAIRCILLDPRTHWSGQSTARFAPIVSVSRRDIGAYTYASESQVYSSRTYKHDKMLGFDLTVKGADRSGLRLRERGDPTPTPWFDFSTLPES